jgi:hypothetical protein
MDNIIEQAIDGYYNDGYIYCIKTNSFIDGNEIVKIGKISMKDSEEITLSTLLSRYSTYHPNCIIYKSVRVSNCHRAEVNIFELLKGIHYKKEHFYFDEKKIKYAFELIKIWYPDINTQVSKFDIDQVSNLNKRIRQKF